MSNYRTVEPVSYVQDGVVVSLDADRLIELTDNQAALLAGRVVRLENADTMFPDGSPLIEHTIVRSHAAPVEVEVEPLPAPTPVRKYK